MVDVKSPKASFVGLELLFELMLKELKSNKKSLSVLASVLVVRGFCLTEELEEFVLLAPGGGGKRIPPEAPPEGLVRGRLPALLEPPFFYKYRLK